MAINSYYQTPIGLTNFFSEKEPHVILNDPDLFHAAYSTALYPTQQLNENFLVNIGEDKIEISGKPEMVSQMQKVVEVIRQFFIKGLDKSHFDILVYHPVKLRDCCYLFEDALISEVGCDPVLDYYKYIKPALPQLARFCGASYQQSETYRRIQALPDIGTQKMEVIRIQWQKEFFRLHHLPLKPLEERNIRQDFYDLYQKFLFWDCSLICKDNSAIRTHFTILYLYGGKFFKGLPLASMTESQTHKIAMKNYSESVIRAFMDFLYLGANPFIEKIKESDASIEFLIELFELANQCENTAFIDCCTNLMTVRAEKNDLEKIKYKADLYDNEQLKQLEKHLRTKEIELVDE